LIDALAYLVNREDLVAVGVEVHDPTILCPAEQIWLVRDVSQADRKQRLDRLAVHGLAFLPARWAGAGWKRGANNAGQLAGSRASFWHTTAMCFRHIISP
jgi:hypothetical protein